MKLIRTPQLRLGNVPEDTEYLVVPLDIHNPSVNELPEAEAEANRDLVVRNANALAGSPRVSLLEIKRGNMLDVAWLRAALPHMKLLVVAPGSPDDIIAIGDGFHRRQTFLEWMELLR